MKQTFTKSMFTMALMPLLFSAGAVLAQETSPAEPEYKNQVKWNVPAAFLKNFTFQYERAIAKKISVGVHVRFASKSKLPFQGTIESLIDDKEAYDRIKDFKTGNFSISPEVRFYLGEQVFKGFYLAPFGSYSSYNASGPFRFQSSQGTLDMPLEGNIKTISGGLYIGSQFNVSKRVGLDLFIGPNFGALSGTISGKKTLNTDEQNGLRSGLNDLEEIPMVKSKYTVDGNGASVDLDGNWPGLRAGLSVAFRF
ncbi:DUF3575 domain-containing protein [Pedobacter sp. GR22-6]|uniref:DUF3575 domain-containing protein n=1 Tax=Pedobacter sp. GR22-6 TaxID=3127957 RepID=UPI00307E0814